jgi:hypothetical protein
MARDSPPPIGLPLGKPAKPIEKAEEDESQRRHPSPPPPSIIPQQAAQWQVQNTPSVQYYVIYIKQAFFSPNRIVLG